MELRIRWSFSLELVAIDDGGLKINLTPDASYSREKPCQTTMRCDAGWPLASDPNDPWEKMKDYFETLEKQFIEDISQTEDNLNQYLTTVNKVCTLRFEDLHPPEYTIFDSFIFPGARHSFSK